MFDVGFSELMLIAIVALVVIGPERLPRVARTLGHLFGRLQRYVNDVKADISREIELDELKKFKEQFEEAAQSVESSVRAEVASAEASLGAIAAEVNPEPPASAEKPVSAPVPGAPEATDAAVISGSAAAGTGVDPAVAADVAPAPTAGVEHKTTV